jgi:myo-inositol-1(or 4)-monophosphatase
LGRRGPALFGTAPASGGRAGLAGAALATGFPFRIQARIDTYLRVFKAVFLEVQSIRRAGSAALDLAYVSAGIFDGFFELGLSPWDSAAGAVLVSESGGVVTDFDGGEAWRKRGNILAAGPGVHSALAALVAGLGVRDEDL